MLRTGEMLPIHRDELNTDNDTPSVDIPARRVKKRRVINQPLSDLALEIIKEAMGNYEFAFTGRFGDAPLARNAMASALRGTKKLVKGVKVTRTPGICELLGIAPFTPHDLRRTAATMCGELGLSEAGISLCLDHQANKDENGKPLPASPAGSTTLLRAPVWRRNARCSMRGRSSCGVSSASRCDTQKSQCVLLLNLCHKNFIKVSARLARQADRVAFRCMNATATAGTPAEVCDSRRRPVLRWNAGGLAPRKRKSPTG